jgi:hypothetical protein
VKDTKLIEDTKDNLLFLLICLNELVVGNTDEAKALFNWFSSSKDRLLEVSINLLYYFYGIFIDNDIYTSPSTGIELN